MHLNYVIPSSASFIIYAIELIVCDSHPQQLAEKKGRIAFVH